MHNVLRRDLNTAEIAEIESFADAAKSDVVREVLRDFVSSARSGNQVIAVEDAQTFSPAEAAKKIGMSRTHLYKLLDRGDLPFHRVGSHRKIYAHDLIEFEQKRHKDRIDLAERFAHSHENIAAVDREIADLL